MDNKRTGRGPAMASALLVLFGLQPNSLAQFDPGDFTNTYSYPKPMATWSFNDTNGWTSDLGYAPLSFTNLTASLLGDGTAVVVDSTNAAGLQYNVIEGDGTTNLTVDAGSIGLWFAPSWSGTNEGGTGPGTWGRLIEVGSANSNGWWSLYVDPDGVNIYFTGQTNGGLPVTYLAAPIDWTTNYWHSLALVYTATNTVLYLDASLAASGTGMTDFPGPEVLSNGFFIGSDSAGSNQAHGMFDDIATYNVPIRCVDAGVDYVSGMITFLLNPLNSANFVHSPGSSPSSSPSYYDVISGAGYLQFLGASGSCVGSAGVWMTNLSAHATSQGMTFSFTIAGGTPGLMYDIFATPALKTPLTNGVWTWLGQGVTCANYSIPGLPTNGPVLFILGTPLDSDGDGLTDAYELLVSHSDPRKVDTDGKGLPDGWQVLHFGGIGNNPNSDPDSDGLTNLQEYLYGTDPNRPEGVTVWVSSPNGTTSLP